MKPLTVDTIQKAARRMKDSRDLKSLTEGNDLVPTTPTELVLSLCSKAGNVANDFNDYTSTNENSRRKLIASILEMQLAVLSLVDSKGLNLAKEIKVHINFESEKNNFPVWISPDNKILKRNPTINKKVAGKKVAGKKVARKKVARKKVARKTVEVDFKFGEAVAKPEGTTLIKKKKSFKIGVTVTEKNGRKYFSIRTEDQGLNNVPTNCHVVTVRSTDLPSAITSAKAKVKRMLAKEK